jgi:hypothetical protein
MKISKPALAALAAAAAAFTLAAACSHPSSPIFAPYDGQLPSSPGNGGGPDPGQSTGTGGFPYWPVTQGTGDAQGMANIIALDTGPNWRDDVTGEVLHPASAQCEQGGTGYDLLPPNYTDTEFLCNITFSNGSFNSYWVQPPKGDTYEAGHRLQH